MAKTSRILAINCTTPEDLRKVFDRLHAGGLEKEGLPLYNVFVHTFEFNRGMRFVMLNIDKREVKVAAKADAKNSRIKIVTTETFLKEVF